MSDWVYEHPATPVLIAQADGVASAHTAVTPSIPAVGESATHSATTLAVATPGHAAAHETAHGGEHVSPWVFFGFSLFAFLLLILLTSLGLRRAKLIPRGMQNTLEMLMESLYGLPEQVMGARGRQYAPFVLTFFLYIMTMNLCGLVPFFKPGTASLSITLGLAIVAFFGVQYFGFKAHGIKYLAHFLGPVPAMAFLILPLELISELIRPLSLSIRLYGNIFGEEQVIGALATQLNPLVAVIMLPLQLLTSILQAFVFTLLVTVYISLATEKHDAAHGESGEAPAH